MNRLKVGDKVKVKDGFYQGHPETSRYNIPRGVGVIETYHSDNSILVRYGELVTPPVNGNVFDLVEDGPVRTVTRKEIVPGRYGCVSVVSETNGDRIQLHLETTCEGLTSWYDAPELRAAAEVFTQLADALEDQK